MIIAFIPNPGFLLKRTEMLNSRFSGEEKLSHKSVEKLPA